MLRGPGPRSTLTPTACRLPRRSAARHRRRRPALPGRSHRRPGPMDRADVGGQRRQHGARPRLSRPIPARRRTESPRGHHHLQRQHGHRSRHGAPRRRARHGLRPPRQRRLGPGRLGRRRPHHRRPHPPPRSRLPAARPQAAAAWGTDRTLTPAAWPIPNPQSLPPTLLDTRAASARSSSTSPGRGSCRRAGCRPSSGTSRRCRRHSGPAGPRASSAASASPIRAGPGAR